MPRRGSKRRGRKGRNSSLKSMMKSTLRRMNPPQKKFLDLTVGSGNDISTRSFVDLGEIALLTEIARGTDHKSREGSKIKLTSLQFKFCMSANGSHTQSCCSWMIVYDKTPGASLPAIADILASEGTGTQHQTFLPLNVGQNPGRFQIIRKWKKTFHGSNASPLDTTSVYLDEFIRLGNRIVKFGATQNGATVGDHETGALYLVTLGTVPSASSANAVKGEGSIRLRFEDHGGV